MMKRNAMCEEVIPISLFNQGKAESIFGEVKRAGVKIVTRYNKPVCILISPDVYVRLTGEYESAQLSV